MFRQALHRRAHTHTHTHTNAPTHAHTFSPLYPFFSLEIWHNIQSADKLHFISLEDLTQTPPGSARGEQLHSFSQLQTFQHEDERWCISTLGRQVTWTISALLPSGSVLLCMTPAGHPLGV